MSKIAQALFRTRVASIFAEQDTRTVCEWCEDELWITVNTQNPGPVNMGITPYYREVLNCFGNALITDLVIVGATQTGKTTVIQLGVAWRIYNMPAPALWVMDTEKNAESFSVGRWQPMMRASPCMAELIPADKSKFKILEQHYPGCSLNFTGSNSPGNLASRPAGLLLLDETDKFKGKTKTESNAIALAENRTKSFVHPLRIKTSTPSVEQGVIWQEYAKGTQEKYFMPCPHCGEKIDFQWAWVKWTAQRDRDDHQDQNQARATAHYECQLCHGKIDDGDKFTMVHNGEWIAQNPNAPAGFRSFHLSSLYSLQVSCSWGSLVVLFLQRLASFDLEDFENSTLAIPRSTGNGMKITSKELREVMEHSPKYLLGEFPRTDIAAIVTTVDVNLGMFRYVVRAWYGNGSSSLLDYGVRESYSALMELVKVEYKVGDIKITSMFNFMDSGWRTEEDGGVYEFCVVTSGGQFIPVKGATKTQGLREIVEESANIIWRGYQVPLLRFNEPQLKYELHFARIRERKGNWWLPINIGPDYEKQLLDEHLEPKPGGAEWVDSGNNHFGDCEKMQLIFPAFLSTICKNEDGTEAINPMSLLAQRVAESFKITA